MLAAASTTHCSVGVGVTPLTLRLGWPGFILWLTTMVPLPTRCKPVCPRNGTAIRSRVKILVHLAREVDSRLTHRNGDMIRHHMVTTYGRTRSTSAWKQTRWRSLLCGSQSEKPHYGRLHDGPALFKNLHFSKIANNVMPRKSLVLLNQISVTCLLGGVAHVFSA